MERNSFTFSLISTGFLDIELNLMFLDNLPKLNIYGRINTYTNMNSTALP